MLATVTPLAATPQQNIYPQQRREGISSAVKLVYFVGLLAFSVFGGGFFAVLLANHQRQGSFTPQHPLANRLSRRDICTDAPIGVATGPELTLAASHIMGSHTLVQGVGGNYIETWLQAQNKKYVTFFRLIDSGLNAGAVVPTSTQSGTGYKTGAVGWQDGGYNLFTTSIYTENLIIQIITHNVMNSIPVSAKGVAGSSHVFLDSDQLQTGLLSVTSLPSGEAVVCAIENQPYMYTYTQAGTWNSYQVDGSTAQSSLITCSTLSNNNIVYFWKNSNTIYGTVVTKNNLPVVPKKTILSINVLELTSTVLSNQNIVLAWVNPSTNRVEFKIIDSGLSSSSSVFVADRCSTSAQSNPQLIQFWNGFALLLAEINTGEKKVYAYRFNPDGTPVGGRFPLSNSTYFYGTNPVVAPLGKSSILTGWSNGGLALKPFDLNSSPFAIGTIPAQSATAGIPFSLSLSGYFTDLDLTTGFDNLTYSVASGPTWLSVNSNSLIASGTPGASAIGTQPFTLRASDLYGKSAEQSFDITTSNRAPYVAWQPPDIQLALNSYFYQPLDRIFIDPESFSVNLSVSGTPGWLAFANQVLSGTASTVGLSIINITGTDPFGASNSTSFLLSVIAEGTGNHPPQVNSPIPPITKDGGTPFTYTIPLDAFTDIDGDSLTYLASLPNNFPLPSWLLFDQQLGIFSGNPTNANAGEYTIVIRAIDPSGAFALQTFTMTIKDSTNFPPYVAFPLARATAFVGELFQEYIGGIFADPNAGDKLILSVNFFPEVTWINFDPSKAMLSGTPGHGDVTPVEVTITARDKGGLSATSTVVVNVEGDNWFIYIFKIVGPIFSVLGALATIYKYRHQIKDYAISLKRKITPVNSQKGIALVPVSHEADDTQLLQGNYQAFNDGDDKA